MVINDKVINYLHKTEGSHDCVLELKLYPDVHLSSSLGAHVK